MQNRCKQANPKMKICPFVVLLVLTGCGPSVPPDGDLPAGPQFEMTGKLESRKLDEASGLQAGGDGSFFVINDEGNRVFMIDESGRDLGSMKVQGAGNHDWEDLTRVIGDSGPLLVIADTGDNLQGRRKSWLYFVREPQPGEYDGELKLKHKLEIRYPDGAHDVESVAFDPGSDMILLLTKRDQPPRLYGIPRDLALWEDEVEAEFLAEVPGFRPPTRIDFLSNPGRGLWVSQPTGMDISPDGRTAAVITYRSLYLFHREDGENWAETFQRAPVEYEGPPGFYDEAVSFGHEPGSLYVTGERRPAPIYRLDYRESP